MAETILISNRYRLRRLDEKNLVLQEYRAPKGAQAKSSDPRWVDMNGAGVGGPFFSTVGGALVWLLNHRMINDSGDIKSINTALERMQAIADDLRKVSVG